MRTSALKLLCVSLLCAAVLAGGCNSGSSYIRHELRGEPRRVVVEPDRAANVAITLCHSVATATAWADLAVIVTTPEDSPPLSVSLGRSKDAPMQEFDTAGLQTLALHWYMGATTLRDEPCIRPSYLAFQLTGASEPVEIEWASVILASTDSREDEFRVEVLP